MFLSILQKIFAAIVLIAFSWLYLLIAILVRLTSIGLALYCSIRLGHHRKPILIWKFRTMHAEIAMEVLAAILESREWRQNQKIIRDPRLTGIGKILRRFSLDELPQFWNILNGSMSLVGPRPITREEEKKYGKYSNLIHTVKPGLTGLWQVSGRNLTTYHRRIAINIYYVKHKNWKLDLWIIYKTFRAVFGGKGAF
jgi:lipopolysaccharide/colanic/teichoic acid biosynthesis glycosyltransferase